jgi:hypothetical protein
VTLVLGWLLVFLGVGLLIEDDVVGGYYLGLSFVGCLVVARAPTWPRWVLPLVLLAVCAQTAIAFSTRSALAGGERVKETYCRELRAAAGEQLSQWFAAGHRPFLVEPRRQQR